MKILGNYSRDGRSPIPKNERTSRVMSAIRAKNTKPEIEIRKALWAERIRGYRLHLKKLSGKPDIVFPRKKVAIFINGCFWHRCPHCMLSLPKSNTSFWEEKFATNVERDIRKARLLKNEGWQVLTIWECQINEDLAQQVKKIKEIVHE